MVSIKELIQIGYRCPRCDTKSIRGGYHEYQVLDSFICELCGLRWNEDLKAKDLSSWKDLLEDNERLIWVLHLSTKPNEPLSNPHSSDDQEWEEWIEKGYTNEITGINPSKRKRKIWD